MPSRRELLAIFGGLLASPWLHCSAKARDGDPAVGCFAGVVSSLAGPTALQHAGSSGISRLDREFQRDIRGLQRSFGVRPAFSFFDEPAEIGPNAFATSERLISPRSDGTVLFGRRLIQRYLVDPDGKANVVHVPHMRAVLAHEYAHILQVKLQYPFQMPTPWREMQADFLSAWNLSSRFDSPYAIAGMFHRLGDLDFGNPDHHGTPPQRLVMCMEGYYFARENRRANATEAASRAASLLSVRADGAVDVLASRNWFSD